MTESNWTLRNVSDVSGRKRLPSVPRSARVALRLRRRDAPLRPAGVELNTEDQGLAAVASGLRRNLAVLLLVSVPVFLGVAVYAETRPAVYTAESTLSFTPRLGSSVGADVIRLVLPRYVAYLAAPSTLGRVSTVTGVDDSVLSRSSDASIQTDTANLTVTVKLASGQRAAEVANAFADAALVYARGDDLLEGQIVARALPSDTPSGPPRRLLEIAGLLAAVLTGVAVALTRERLRPRVLTVADLERAAGVPVLGRLPASAQLGRGETVEVSDPLLGPAVRAAWLQLERADRAAPVRSLAVTSPATSNGKTTLSTALGAAAARAGRRVILLDADTQRAGLTLALGPFESPAMAQALRGTGPVERSLHEGPVDGVRVLPTDVRPADVAEMRRLLPGLLERLREHSDLVVLDCPPLQDEDGRGVVAMAEGVLLVVAVGTARQEVADAVAVVAALQLRLVGTVLNGGRAPSRAAGYERPSLVENDL